MTKNPSIDLNYSFFPELKIKIYCLMSKFESLSTKRPQ